eukprot:Nk52_evm44s207 gene=Nk52_evmTU44s207
MSNRFFTTKIAASAVLTTSAGSILFNTYDDREIEENREDTSQEMLILNKRDLLIQWGAEKYADFKNSSFVAESFSTFKYLLAGGISGAVSRTCVSPLERLKILFQVRSTAEPPKVVQTLVDIGKKEGIVGYFKGNGTNVIRMVPYSAVQFASYERYKKLVNLDEGHSTLKRLFCGAMAGVTSVATTYPLDLVRTRLAAQGEGPLRKYTSIPHAIKTIFREEGGIRGLYGGMVPTLLGVAPYVGLNFTTYETLKLYCVKLGIGVRDEDSKELTVPVRLICGGIAGATAQTFAYPLDLIRRRMQMKGAVEHSYHYKGTADAFRTIVRTDGVRGLFKGMVPNYLKVVPSISISFVVYEVAKKVLCDERK